MKYFEPYKGWKKTLAPFQNHWCVVGCSGGIDSMVLLHFLVKEKFQVHVVHVNYHKRGEASLMDEQFVNDFCNQHSVSFSVFNFRKTHNQSSNFQEAAREFRYAKFEKIAAKYEKSVIVLGHHADDQVETFFMNLARNSGVLGLAGIPVIRNNFVRPLLNSSKIELSQYADIHELKWREDTSNTENDYARNRWRNEFIPLLENQIPGIKSSILTLVNEFQNYHKSLFEAVKHHVRNIQNCHILGLNEFENLNEFERFEIWRQLKQLPQTFSSFNKLAKLHVGKHTKMINGFEKVIREKDYLYFESSSKERLTIKLIINNVKILPNEFDKNKIYLDATRIQGNLILRKWRNGDKMSPIGMNGSQLVSDIIKDAKIPHHKKNEIMIVCDELEIHWVVGLKIGKNSLATSNSASIICVKIDSTTL